MIITHDLGVVAEVADEIAVMYAGRIVERAPADTIFHAPEHPYTWGLLGLHPAAWTPPRDEELVPISGRPPSLINLPGGCSFHPRCPYVREAHRTTEPRLEPIDRTTRRTRSPACSTPARASKLWARPGQGPAPEEAALHGPQSQRAHAGGGRCTDA